MTLVVVLLLLGEVKAQPCRPTVACTAELVPAGHVEAELGTFISPSASTGALNALIKVSVLDWLQVQVGSDNFFVRTPEQTAVLDGAVAVLKARLFPQGAWAPTTSLSTRLVVATRPPLPALQTGFDWGVTAHLSKDVGPLHFDLNGTFSLLGLREAQGQGAFVTAWGLPSGLGLALEVHSTFGNPRLSNDGGARVVASWSPVGALVFDLGVDVGFFPGTRAWSVFGGLVFVPTAG